MGLLRGAVARGFAIFLLALAVSPITAPFSAFDLQLALGGQAPHEGASLKVKAPDHQPVASVTAVSRALPIEVDAQKSATSDLRPNLERLPVDPPLRL